MLEVFNWVAAIIVSLGGASALILAMGKWLGKLMADSLLEKQKSEYQTALEGVKSEYQTALEGVKSKYQNELEGLKSKYQSELETKKSELEKSKSLFLRYSEHQFSLYNEVWKDLTKLSNSAKALWQHAEVQKLKDFSEQLHNTKNSVEQNALLFEDDHYQELLEILKSMGNFEFGKKSLITLRNEDIANYDVDMGINNITIRAIVDGNKDFLNNFNSLLKKVYNSFRQQIKGE